MKKILAFSVVLLAMSASMLAQPSLSATATATATIVAPLSIARTVDMNFGNVSVDATPGTVVLTPAGGRSTTGGCALPSVTGTVTAASFDITGFAGTVYSITLPAGATTLNSGTDLMTVDTWQSSLTPTASRTLTTGAETLNVGATLHVGGGQPGGTYVSATPFTVSINYN